MPADRIDLIILGETTGQTWPAGEIAPVTPTVEGVRQFIRVEAPRTQAAAWLFWDTRLGAPDAAAASDLFESPGDVFHAGLCLGMAGRPGLLDFIAPTWMLNADPPATIAATSWRISLRACLAPVPIIRALGGLRPGFNTLAGAALEMGHRWIMGGALVRHAPDLLAGRPALPEAPLLFEDELRFARHRYGPRWAAWAALRACTAGYVSPGEAARAWRRCRAEPFPAAPSSYHRLEKPPAGNAGDVSVLIPTLGRYDYLRPLLAQLRLQTTAPREIIVIDQTPEPRRDRSIAGDFLDLPLVLLYHDRAGQCSARNAGLQKATGQYVLFLDDDDEIAPDLIEAHLDRLDRAGAEASCGAALETGTGALPEAYTSPRASDVFLTGNTLLRREALRRSGLFDLAYEHGPRADGDLGMRLYLSGSLMVYDPTVSVLHHHAPSGGLRAHRARVVTYAASRQRLMVRHLPAVTEIYLTMRYFTPRQVREELVHRTLGTLSIRGGLIRRLAKMLTGLLLLPDTLIRIRRRRRAAQKMLGNFPQIMWLEEENR